MNASVECVANISVRDRDGIVHRLTARPGFTLMEILRDAGLPVAAICGGNCLCATCHIYVDEPWRTIIGEPNADEAAKLAEIPFATRAYRLGCQVEYSTELNGLALTLAPED